MTCLQILCLLPCYRALMELALHVCQLHLYIRTHTNTHTLTHKHTHTPTYTHTHTTKITIHIYIQIYTPESCLKRALKKP